MTGPIFRNQHHERTLILATPRGVSVTVHPGDMVVGEYFRPRVKEGLLVELTTEEANTITLGQVEYVC